MKQTMPEDRIQCCDDLSRPTRLWTRAEILSHPSPVPKAPGVYAWYFRTLVNVPFSNCLMCGDFALMYVGISPSAPPTDGKLPSGQSLYHRLRYHMKGNAEGSTLRLLLGCILADHLGIELRRVGSGMRFTFSTGEAALSKWLEENAGVVWHVFEKPWELEKDVISTLNLPLNLEMNTTNLFYPGLTELLQVVKARAKALPILPR